MNIYHRRLGIAAILAGASLPVAVQAAPVDAGALRQQIEREREAIPPPRSAAPETATPAKKSKQGDKTQVTVEHFRFEGNTLLSAEELAAAVKPFLNHPISFTELQGAAAAVGEAYRAKGWVVRSFLPKQDIVDGTVTIKIVEAHFGKVKVEGATDTWITPERIDAMVAARQQTNEPLSNLQLDRALLLIDDLPGVAASGRLQQGEKNGQTDLAVKLADEAFVTGLASIDNEGARATGAARIQGDMEVMSPLRFGDQLSLYALGSEGMRFAQARETFPVGYDGWRVGANASVMDYDLVPSEFDALDGKGGSTSLGLEASYPLIRQRETNLYFNVNYDHRYFYNDTQGTTSSSYQTDDYTTALRGNLLDQLGGGGVNMASLGLTIGNLSLGNVNSGEDPTVGGGFHKALYSLSRLQTITSDVFLYAGLSGQIAPDKKLDSSEMFYLGGPTGVRAYPVSEASGTSGTLVNIEPRWNFAPNYQVSSFYDYGYVHNPGTTKSYALKGAGLALAWQSDLGIAVKATWSHRIGDNPDASTTGKDQDGSLSKNRVWLTLSKQF